MDFYLKAVLVVLGSYLIGSINPAYIYGKLKGNIDIRKNGTGNPGGSNAMIVYGRGVGLAVIILDILKGALCSRLAIIIMGGVFVPVLAFVACVMGHLFPFYMNFRGGKGLACYAGGILGLNPLVFLGMFVFVVIVLLIRDYIALLPLTGSIVFPVAYCMVMKNWWLLPVLLIPAIPMWIKHLENIRRIMSGQEIHTFKFLHKGDQERKRVGFEKISFDEKDNK